MTLPRKALYFVLAASFIGALAFLTWREPRQLAATGAVTQGPLQETFTEEAKTRLKQRYAIAAPVSGTLQRITLEPGDAVQEGQPVAYIAPAASTLLDDRSRAQAEADVKSGQSQQAAAPRQTQKRRPPLQLLTNRRNRPSGGKGPGETESGNRSTGFSCSTNNSRMS